MNVRVVLASVFAMLLIAGPALAQPGVTPVGPPQAYEPPTPSPTYTKRYGTTIALADGASVAAMFIGVVVLISEINTDCDDCTGDDDDNAALGIALMIGGAAGYVFGGPLIHNHHGNGSGSGKSLALRLGLPLVGALVGAALDDSSDQDGDDDKAGQLFALGAVSAMVIDWTMLAKKEVRLDPPVTPYAAPVRGGGMTFGVGGAF